MQTRLKPRYLLEVCIALLVLVLDQVTKALAVAKIAPHEFYEVIPGFFNLVNTRNRGAAFGFLHRADVEWSFWLFAAATVLAVVVILHMTRKVQWSAGLFTGFGLIMGGAVGNLIDRIRLRAVIDFLDFSIGGWHWPAFNVADTAICTGAVLAFILLWKSPAFSSDQGGRPGSKNAETASTKRRTV